jgi:hypothetical protein
MLYSGGCCLPLKRRPLAYLVAVQFLLALEEKMKIPSQKHIKLAKEDFSPVNVFNISFPWL